MDFNLRKEYLIINGEAMEKKCLIVGANGGMGRAITIRLLKENYNVIATYHNAKEHLEIFKNDRNVNFLFWDLTDLRKDDLIDEKLEGVTDVIFAAGKESLKNITNCSKKEMVEQYNINVFSPLLIIQSILSIYGETLQNIIFISSKAAADLKPSNGVYALSKACLCNMVKMLDDELKNRGIRVNCIVPGWCETEMAERIAIARGRTIDDIKNCKLENKLVHAKEIAEICMFLLSDMARNIHGQFIGIDVPEK